MRKFKWMMVILMGVAGWSSAHADADANAGDDWGAYQSQVVGQWKTYRTDTTETWKKIEQRLLKKWGSETLLPQRKIYVRYDRGDEVRTKIDYEKGEIQIESLAKNQLKSPKESQAVVETLVRDGLLDKNELPESMNWDAEHDTVLGGDGKTRDRQCFTLKMVPNHLALRARRYLPLVLKWSEKNQVEPALVLAVIERESAFNPKARSWVPAYGLMQIVPQYAGAEVLHETPSEEFLYDPENNIRVGTEYLKLLERDYFRDVPFGDKKRYLVTCSYNWGPHRIRRAIERGVIDLSTSSLALFETLLATVPAETRGYLRKVTQSYYRYRKDSAEEKVIPND